jgi:hypothetical protein
MGPTDCGIGDGDGLAGMSAVAGGLPEHPALHAAKSKAAIDRFMRVG